MTRRITRRPFVYMFSHGGRVTVPAGAPVEKEAGRGMYWIDPRAFSNGLDRHDATYYGVRVPADNVEEVA